jgi:inner membrane transporter RhtA
MTTRSVRSRSAHWTQTGLPVVLLLAAMVSFQTGASIAKTLFPLVGPIGTVAIRVGLGTIILCITLRPWRVRFQPSAWCSLLIYGVSVGLMNLFFYLSLSRVPQGVAVAIEFLGPLSVAVWSSRRAIDFFWISIAAVSLVLLLPVTHIGTDTNLLGILFALAAGGCWALYIIYGQKAGGTHGAQATAIGSVIAASIVVPIGLVKSGRALFSSAVLIPGFFVAVLSTAFPYTLEMIALTRLPARTFGVLMSIEPALGALIAYVYLNERLSGLQWTAIGFIVLASIGATVCAQRHVPPV